MSGQEPDKHEKTEDATPFKLEEAKKKGVVPKSQEVGVAASLIAILLIVLGLGSKLASDVLDLCRDLVIQGGSVSSSIQPFLLNSEEWVWRGINILLPSMLILLVVGVFANLIQTGPIFSTHPLKPDLKRLSPIAGFKRIFSKKILFELLKSLIKLAALTVVLSWVVKSEMDGLAALAYVDTNSYIDNLIKIGVNLLFKLVVIMVVIAILDHIFVSKTFLTSMKMTRRELKDEYKRRDGDPQIKSKRRELERELRKRAESLSAVRSADVVITNPTHYAVTLKYDRTKMAAPAVTGKGVGKLAAKIREEAWVHGVPVIQSPRLARLLFKKVKIDHPVPDSTYVSVAKILHQAARMRK